MNKKKLAILAMIFVMIFSLISYTTSITTYAIDVPAGPAITSVNLPENGVYKEGQALDIGLVFEGNVTLSDESSYIPITIGDDVEKAYYHSGSGSNEIHFVYTINAGLTDNDGIEIGDIKLNTDTIKGDDDADAVLTYPESMRSTAGIRIDSQAHVEKAAINPDNSVEVTFNEGIYGTGLVAPAASDFSYNFQANGGGITGFRVDEVTAPNGDPLSGGESVIRFVLKLTGVATGVETIQITPESASLTDAVGNQVSPDATDTLYLQDASAPIPGNSGRITVSGDPSPMGVTFTWSAATGSENVVYYIYRSRNDQLNDSVQIESGRLIATTSALTYTASGLAPNTTYYFNVKAANASNNVSVYRALAVTTADGKGIEYKLTADKSIVSKGESVNFTTNAPGEYMAAFFAGHEYRRSGSVDNMSNPFRWGEYIGTGNQTDIVVTYRIYDFFASGGRDEGIGVTWDTPFLKQVQVLFTLDPESVEDHNSPTPGAINSVENSSKTNTTITLSWTAASDDFSSHNGIDYAVYRSSSNNISTVEDAQNNGVKIIDWTKNITDCTVTGLTAGTAYYFNVFVRDASGNIAAYTPISASTAAGGGTGGRNNTPSAPPMPPAPPALSSTNGGRVSTEITPDGQTATLLTIDQDALTRTLAAQNGPAPVLAIQLPPSAGVSSGVLTGEMVSQLDTRQAILEVSTDNASYTLPSSQIDITNIQSQLGAPTLADVRVNIQISEPSQTVCNTITAIIQGAGNDVITSPVDFEIICDYNYHEIPADHFKEFVEREIAIPSGVDAARITTGVVMNSDGTFSHVPTQVIVINGRYFARINSLTNSTYTVIYNPATFKDVENHWAKAAVNDMGARMVISGTGNGSFEPDKEITRAEFATIVVRALGLRPDTEGTAFTDVKKTDWFNGYVKTAVSYGIITGYDAKTFGANDKITREQAMAMIARAMKIADGDLLASDSEETSLLGNYTDKASVSGYAENGVASCIKAGVISGRSANSISPKSNITRAEVAVAIQRMLQKAKLI